MGTIAATTTHLTDAPPLSPNPLPARHFLFCTQPIIGHVEPGLIIADALKARGHAVAWYTGSCMKAYIEQRGFPVFTIESAFDYDGADPNQYFPDRNGLTGIADLKFILKRVFAAAMPMQSDDIRRILKVFPADVLVADFVTFGPRVVSEQIGIPWAAYGFSALSLSSKDTAPYGLGLAPSATGLGRLRNSVLNALMRRVLMADVVQYHDNIRQSIGLPALGLGPTDTPLSPYLYLQGSVPEFEYPRSDLPAQVHYVGALTPRPQAKAFVPPVWWAEVMSGARPVVLVTQGTMDNKDLGELIRPALQALANENVWVVVTTGRETTAEEVGPVPANARVIPFVPYHELLPHVSVMLSNGGYNGVLIALSNGVPLVVCGAQSDKPEICARVEWSGAGLWLRGNRVKPAQIRAATRNVLQAARFQSRAKEYKTWFGQHRGGKTSAQLLEQLAVTRKPVL